MARAFAVATTIDHPVGAVWERMVDWETADRWMSGVDALRAEGPTEAGTTLVFTARGKERLGRIASLDPGRSITLRSSQSGVTADYVYECEAHGSSTRVSLVADCTTSGRMRVLGPLVRYAIRRADSGQLEAFAATFGATQGIPGGERRP